MTTVNQLIAHMTKLKEDHAGEIIKAVVMSPMSKRQLKEACEDYTKESLFGIHAFTGINILELSVMNPRECLAFTDEKEAYRFIAFAEALSQKGNSIEEVIRLWNIRKSREIVMENDKIVTMNRVPWVDENGEFKVRKN